MVNMAEIMVYRALIMKMGENLKEINALSGATRALDLTHLEPVEDTLGFEVSELFLHLAASDGVIDSEDAECFNAIFNPAATPDEMFCSADLKRLVDENGLGSASFVEDRVPMTFVISSYSDEWALKHNGREIAIAENLIEGFERLGNAFINLNGDPCASEEAALEAYVSSVRGFIPGLRRMFSIQV